ncbi:bifunctional phosphoglucose/phosphomannose isomerase [Halocola ammonii]
MKQLIEQFPKHIQHALEIGQKANFNTAKKQVENVVITGLGGSGIGGKIVSQLVSKEANVPILVNNDYTLPGFVNEKSLVIVSSYSGNTEETLTAMRTALDRGAEVACITSGGEVLEMAGKENLDHVVIPGGNPPRAMFGYSAVQQFFILNAYGVIPSNHIDELSAASDLLTTNKEAIKEKAGEIVKAFDGRTPVIYIESHLEGVAVRWRQQLNENSKILCWHHVFPEMNHNELVGWKGGSNQLSVLMLRTKDDQKRNAFRMDVCKPIFEGKCDRVNELWAEGESAVERAFYLIYVGDWVSQLMAEKREVDPVEIEVIEYLKGELSKV